MKLNYLFLKARSDVGLAEIFIKHLFEKFPHHKVLASSIALCVLQSVGETWGQSQPKTDCS